MFIIQATRKHLHFSDKASLPQNGSKKACSKFYEYQSCGLYYKPITIVNVKSSIVNKIETSLIDKARVVIYDQHMFIVRATGSCLNSNAQFNITKTGLYLLNM
jgi:hypothetical protein